MASWPTKTSRTGRPPLHLHRNSAARTAAPGVADVLSVWGAAVLRRGDWSDALHKNSHTKKTNASLGKSSRLGFAARGTKLSAGLRENRTENGCKAEKLSISQDSLLDPLPPLF